MTTVLIAEDNPQNLYLLEATLKGYGYTPITATNGREALDSAEKNPPDLIIADILMPEMDGFELCRRWKADPKLNHIPFIFYTATYTDPRDEQFALSLGAERYVIKPQKPDVLIGIVREVLEEAGGEKPPQPEKTFEEEMELLKTYNEVLFRKLQKKVGDLENEIARCNIIEEDLRKSEKFFNSIFEEIPDMIFVKDAADLRFIRFNKAGEELLGISREELIGKGDYDFFPEEQAEFFREKDQEVLSEKRLRDIPEERILTHQMGERILHTKKIPILDESGEPRYLLGISEDITEQKAHEEQINLANHKLELMTEVTYQDIQNKITATLGYLDLEQQEKNQKSRQFYIEKEREILESIHNLIKKTKDYQQIGVNTSRWIAPKEVIRDQFAAISQKKNTILECELEGLEVKTDPLIERVFLNLMVNSIQHGQKTTKITVRYQKTSDGVIVIYEDDGVGIPVPLKEQIFERIVGGRGTFGLFFAREFLNLSGMKIIETGTPGEGARFEITIPESLYREHNQNGNHFSG
ncbi:response regulator [Methanocalculus taiwanensis]|uniref:Response regulator n=1 Tax=Methanocalculus taiwanensis TaxID=106207 RepID=A0ABD4TJF3_9EURY|nr:response regulator [Methanocalculus taiwanensis]MCQ1537480.1 response regulator [Methanocalculus taiwanensis]